ncbi:hypothetical protein V8B97DRAFT_1885612 [Scleroderma yunnanense]
MTSKKQQKHGINLPKSILDHIEREGTSPGAHGSLWRGKGNKKTVSRKDARKKERLDRKMRKAEHFSAHSGPAKRVAEEHNESPKPKRRKTVHFAEDVQIRTLSPSHKSPSNSDTKKSKGRALKELESNVARKLQKQKEVLLAPKSRLEEEDDACITYYEEKLGYKAGKRKKSDVLDGLDDLLDFADSLMSYEPTASGDAEQDSYGSSSEHFSDSESEEALQSDSESEDEGDDEWAGFGVDAGDIDSISHGTDLSTESEEASPSKQELTSPPKRYIPPGLRKQTDSNPGSHEDLTKLTRQLKGLLNRMSEQNMTTVLDGIEEVYRKHRRHDVTSTLSTLIIEGVSSHAMLLDSFVVLHAAFISSMHRLIGVEFAAFVVQSIVTSYEHHLAHADGVPSHGADPSEDRGKECSNLVVLLSELYNFQVIACILMYDLIRELLSKDFTEIRVELLLKILRSCGQQLRYDDPSALKDIVTLAQSKQGDNQNSRVRFMMETLTNLKNNRIKKTAAAQHQGGDAVDRLKKFLTGLGKKRHVQAHEPLRVSLEDLRAAGTKGKWWLVGAAWAGDPLLDHRQEPSKHGADVTDNSVINSLLKLARKQGMNTDIRRSIFIVLMSSDDYLDACERLSQLNLTEVQQREIIRVSLHCSGNEKSYNPYYTLISQHLCQNSHSYKVTLQYWLWDFLRDLGEVNVGGAEVIKNLKDDDSQLKVKSISSSRMKNIAKVYGWWIAKDICSLLILKVRQQQKTFDVPVLSIMQPVDFTLLKPQSRKFLKELFIQIFVASQGSSPVLMDHVDDLGSRNRGVIEDIFMKATKIENLGLGLVFFLSHAFREEGFLKWASLVAKETLQSGMDYIPRL